MTNNKIIIASLVLLFISCFACEKNEVLPIDNYACTFSFSDSSASHPKANLYQDILEKHRRNGLVGSVLLVADKDGLWLGADGKADIASNVDMKSCNTFLIASISKVFTTAATYSYIDKGILSFDAPISNWLDEDVVNNVENADQAQVKHLLAHTSGIADFYTNQFEFDRINKIANEWSKEKVLEYIYGKNASHEMGTTYAYSNTNFLLLAMILERASGLSFEQIYQQEVFNPLALSSAYYSETKPIPDGCVKGYVDIYDNGQFIESEFLYKDELGIGGDGGVAINAYDLAVFFQELMRGNLISSASLTEMTNWFDLPQDWQDDTIGQTENGYGIEKFNTDFGTAVGHSGGIDGFNTLALYFPEEDMTYILLSNSAGNEVGSESQEKILKEVLALMFE